MTVAEIKEYIKGLVIMHHENIKDSNSSVMGLRINGLEKNFCAELGAIKGMLDQLDEQDEWVRLDDENIDIMERYPNEDERVICVNETDSNFFAYYDDYEGEFLLSYDAKTPLKNIVAWRKDVEPFKRKE